jgi:hypothetical protein
MQTQAHGKVLGSGGVGREGDRRPLPISQRWLPNGLLNFVGTRLWKCPSLRDRRTD